MRSREKICDILLCVDPVERIVTENFDLIDWAVTKVLARYSFPDTFRTEIESDAAFALWQEARRYEGHSDVRVWLRQRMLWRVLDAVRVFLGRREGSKARKHRDVASLDATHTLDGQEFDLYDLIGDRDRGSFLEADETLREILDAQFDDRHREVIVRLLLGQSQVEIAEHLGVTESRISQMMTAARRNYLAYKPPVKKEVKPPCKAKPLLLGNWR